MRWSKQVLCLALSCVLIVASSAVAEVKLPALISENMVLQQGKSVPIWGQGQPGEKVTVTLGDQQVSTTTGDDGRWMIKLDPLSAGGPYEMTVAGQNTIKLNNVLVGEVWVGSGQSNMAMTVRGVANGKQEIKSADYPRIRLFTVENKVADQPKLDVVGNWSLCQPDTIPHFSAVAYFFGREIHKSLNVPVGLIHSSWGGTPAESWTTVATLETDPDFKPILDRWAKAVANFPQAKERYEKRMAKWKGAAEQARSKGEKPPQRPGQPFGPGHPHQPGGLYNGMTAPLMPYAIQGVIWYQGEGNAGRAYQYRKLFPAMIRDWRKHWGQGDFPFLFVQLANFKKRLAEPADSHWAELREAQAMTLALANTGMAVTIDIGEADDIHPKNKQDVGRRLALAAEAVAYSREVVYSGPIYDAMSIEGEKVRLYFKHAEGGLAAKGGDPLKGFAIAGADKKFVWADAEIDADTVVVSSNKVADPRAVRYAWANNPECNLYNKAGLPASPFRTDDWPGITFNER